MQGIALGLGLDRTFFEAGVAADSYWVTRVIHYPPLAQGSAFQQTGEPLL